ncbi:hypothetical protein D5086_017355 [Populus alba]|uniref:Uncharacterized protein n=1 Tax=Populus alba TaxID=43335 RepID=A0ACC4BZA1_POPAL
MEGMGRSLGNGRSVKVFGRISGWMDEGLLFNVPLVTFQLLTDTQPWRTCIPAPRYEMDEDTVFRRNTTSGELSIRSAYELFDKSSGCQTEEETALHLSRDCPLASQVLVESDMEMAFSVQRMTWLIPNLSSSDTTRQGMKWGTMLGVALWCIWKSRNKICRTLIWNP